MKKRYIRVQTVARPEKKRTSDQHDKEARIIALAEKMHIKIGGRG